MKKFVRVLSFVFSLTLVLAMLPFSSTAAEAPDIPPENAKATMLISLDFDEVLFESGSELTLDPGASVKLMTALLAFELLSPRMDEYITVTSAMVSSTGNNIALVAGEMIKIRDLFYAMLLRGANDAAAALAICACGSTGEFVTRMNDRAAELGMGDTHYANFTGFHASGAKTTVKDMAVLARAINASDTIMSISSVASYTIPATNLSSARTLSNRNYLLSTAYTTQYYRSDVRGMLYGGTSEAGYTLITTLVSGGLTYLAIVTGAPSYSESNNAYVTMSRLLKYAAGNFGYIKLLSASQVLDSIPVSLSKQGDEVALVPEKDIYVFMPLDYDREKLTSSIELNVKSLSAPIDSGLEVGQVHVLYDEEVIASCALVTGCSLTRSVMLEFQDALISFVTSPMFITAAVFAVASGVAYVLFRAKSIARRARDEGRADAPDENSHKND